MSTLGRRLTLVALDVTTTVVAILDAFVVRFAFDGKAVPSKQVAH